MTISRMILCILVFATFTLPAAVLLDACTEQERARDYGGTTNVNLPCGQKLVVATWKTGANLWYLTRPMRLGEEPETSEFKESSAFNMLEGKVVFRECK